jgi:hypothetical protein
MINWQVSRASAAGKTLLPRTIFPRPDLSHDRSAGVRSMAGQQGRPVFASDDWMLEQQLRAEMEAEAWRRLRQEFAIPEPLSAPPVAAPANRPDLHETGSGILKGLVRFMLAAFGGYLAFLAAVDSGLGELEIWLAVGAAFAVTLSLSMLGAARGFVHAAAETMRWLLIIAAGVGATWLAFNWQG